MDASRYSYARFTRRSVALALGSALVVAALPAAGAQAVSGPYGVPSSTVAGSSVAASTSATTVEIQEYIIKVYSDLFGRVPDAEGLASWTNALVNGTPRVAVANSITSSAEFRTTLIAGSYDWYLGRQPDAAGMDFWLAQMSHGWTISQMESGFISSDEYYGRAGSTDAGWVTSLYADVLGRAAAPSEVAGWTQALDNGMAPEGVSMGFLLSTEHLSTVVDGYYQNLLTRSLDPSGQGYWVGILQRGGRDEVIIGGIIASDEYWNIAVKPAA